MGKKRRRYAREFKPMAVRQVLEGESLRGTARELGISWKILDRWKSEYLKDPKSGASGFEDMGQSWTEGRNAASG